MTSEVDTTFAQTDLPVALLKKKLQVSFFLVTVVIRTINQIQREPFTMDFEVETESLSVCKFPCRSNVW